jgi:hypothetical protein
VRDVLAEISRAGHTDKVRELLVNLGAAKLSAIDPGNFAALLADARAINGEARTAVGFKFQPLA